MVKAHMVQIPMKLPSLNDYIRVCRGNFYSANNLKSHIEEEIGFYLQSLPRLENPVTIDFTWVEKNNRRDYDNIAFAKKFILDAMQKSGKLKNDDRKHVVGFTDSFELGDDYSVWLVIREVGE